MQISPTPLPCRTSATRRTTRTFRRLTALAVATAAIAAACVPASDDTGAPNANPAPSQPPAVRGPQTPTPEGTFITPGERLGVAGCPLFPRNNAFHADITRLQRHPNSDAMIDTVGRGLRMGSVHSGIWQGSRGGIPVNVVDSRSSATATFRVGTYAYMSDLEAHPMPASPRIEGHPGAAWDKHLLTVDSATCRSHEFFYVQRVPVLNVWTAETAVKIDLTTNNPRPRGTAIASGGSMLAGLVRYDEVASGEIDHAISVVVPTISNQGPVWPAFRTDGRSSDPNAPRMGTWLRLRADADLSGLGPHALVIARALQQHGAIISDTGGGFGLSGENDHRWNDADMGTIGNLELGDFEVVDPTPMKVNDATYEIR